MQNEQSPNHAFFLSLVRELPSNDRALDFGCGTGTLVGMARASGVDMVGVDAYPDDWPGTSDETIAPHVTKISGSKLPFPDATFNLVVSNMVFEHMAPDAIEASIKEIARVLKPGGKLICMFPTRDVWFEGHVGVYFPHRMRAYPQLLRGYLRLMFKLGLGYYKNGIPEAYWVDWAANTVQQQIYFHDRFWFTQTVETALGVPHVSIAARYMKFRLFRPSSWLAQTSSFDWPLAFICHARAARAWQFRRA
jgi:SAM-dependent methyltransferase